MIRAVRRAGVLLLALVVAIALVSAVAHAAGAGQACSTRGLSYVVRVTATRTACPAARRLERAWRRAARRSGACIWVDGSTQPGVCTVNGWRCSAYHTVNGWNFPVVCDRAGGRRSVRFVLKV